MTHLVSGSGRQRPGWRSPLAATGSVASSACRNADRSERISGECHHAGGKRANDVWPAIRDHCGATRQFRGRYWLAGTTRSKFDSTNVRDAPATSIQPKPTAGSVNASMKTARRKGSPQRSTICSSWGSVGAWPPSQRLTTFSPTSSSRAIRLALGRSNLWRKYASTRGPTPYGTRPCPPGFLPIFWVLSALSSIPAAAV